MILHSQEGGKVCDISSDKRQTDEGDKTNISIEVSDSETAGFFNVSARGAMQIAVLVEEMRREGYEVLVSRPMVITKRDENDKLIEPYETLYVEVPEEYEWSYEIFGC